MRYRRSELKDIERLQKYERILITMLRLDRFSKSDIWKCGESKSLIGRIISSLLSDGTLRQRPKGHFGWKASERLAYKKEWLDRPVPSHQLKRLSKADRPREKLLNFGPSKLTKAELLAIFLRSGVKGKSALKLSTELLQQFKGVRGIFQAPQNELLEIEGIGSAKVAQIKAVKALAEEYLKEKAVAKKILGDSQEVFDYLYHTMRDLDQEVFKVLMLDGQNQIIEIVDVFKGTITTSNIYPREIIKLALNCGATAVIFAHNHPSGEPAPSKQDKEITRDLVFACRYAGIRVWEHVIVGDNRYFSFADEGVIEEYDKSFESGRRGRRDG